jgi:uncharacterized protein with PQ loop repeat
MQHAPHHIHLRKRTHQLATYPHPQQWVRFLDKFLLVVASVAPLFAIPQIWRILSTESAAGVSPITWGAYAFFNIPWIVYGIVHKERPIIIAYILWLIVNTTVLTLTLVYS